MEQAQALTLPHPVSVTRHHLDNGVQEHCQECVVALAVVDSIKGLAPMTVSVQGGIVYCGPYCYALPDDVDDFIKDFDRDPRIEHYQSLNPHYRSVYLQVHGHPAARFEPFDFCITHACPALNYCNREDQQ